MTFDEVADRLYGLAPEEFTAARDAAAREADDGHLARRIKALRRPTVAAGLVNRLVREHRDEVDALLRLGDELRGLMRGGALLVRGVVERRRHAVAQLTRRAVSGAGREVTAAVEREVAETLDAAVADAGIAEEVRRGRLTTARSYAGLGLAAPLPPPPEAGARRATPGTERQSRHAARDEEEQARRAAYEDARRRAESATAAVRDARAEVGRAERALEAARARLRRAEEGAGEANAARQAAYDALHRRRWSAAGADAPPRDG